MTRARTIFGDWSRDQLVLILGPVVLSILLVVLYAGGILRIGWPALLGLVALINLAGDVAFAVKNERSLKRGSANLCNDVVGSRAVAEDSFTRAGQRYEGTVILAGERWRAVSDRQVAAGERLGVTGRRGLVLDVVPDPA